MDYFVKTLLVSMIVLGAALAAPRAAAQESTNENNTIVRFDFLAGGTNFGSLDLELFDQDKPVTVQNFLLYLRSGAYSNLVIHRLVPGFALQAGRLRVESPSSTNVFDENTDLPRRSFGSITNEFNVGPTLSNAFGTIAMARVAGRTNSASAEWFFNLADNSTLDTNDGGFTVFGRVINTAGPTTGTNLLNYFGSFPTSNITSLCLETVFGFFCIESHNEVPASTVRSLITTNISTNAMSVVLTNFFTNTFVQVNDLYTINASVLRGDMLPREDTAPRLSVDVSKRKVPSTTNATYLFTGTASDNFALERVIYDTSTGREIAEGTETWSAEVPLRPGMNTINLRSIDHFGNESAPETRQVFYSVKTPIALTNFGGGTVLGLTNQQMLEIGRTYTVRAKPGRNNFFLGFSGSFATTSPKMTFQMFEGARINVNFTTNFFLENRGTYHGLIIPRANGSIRTAGYITLKLGPRGLYNGRLAPANANYRIRGLFGVNARTGINGQRGTTPLGLTLTLQTNGTEQIWGVYSDGAEVGDVVLYRADPMPGPRAGQYTFALGRGMNMSDQFGDGFGIGNAIVDQRGRINILGTMPGSGDFKQKVALVRGARWPFHARPKGSSDLLVGWIVLDEEGHGFNGTVHWLSENFTNAVGERIEAMGSRYLPPGPGLPLLDWTSGLVTLSGDDLAEPIEVGVDIQDDELLVAPNPFSLRLSVDSGAGIIGGDFVHPVTQQLTPIEGVVLQSSNAAAGFFPGVRSGSVVIHAAE